MDIQFIMALKNLKNNFIILIFLNAFGCDFLTRDTINAKQKYLATIRSPQSPIIYDSKIVWNEGENLIVFNYKNNILIKTAVSYPFHQYLYPSSPDIITNEFSYYFNPRCDNSERFCNSRDRYKNSIWIIKNTGETSTARMPLVCANEIIDAKGSNIICLNEGDVVNYNFLTKSTLTILNGKYVYLQRDNRFLYLYSKGREDYTIFIIERESFILSKKIQLRINSKIKILKLYKNVIAYIDAVGLILYNYVTDRRKVFSGEQYTSCEMDSNNRYIVTFKAGTYSIVDIDNQNQYRIKKTNASIEIDALLCIGGYCYIVEIHKILPLQNTYKIRKIQLNL